MTVSSDLICSSGRLSAATCSHAPRCADVLLLSIVIKSQQREYLVAVAESKGIARVESTYFEFLDVKVWTDFLKFEALVLLARAKIRVPQ